METKLKSYELKLQEYLLLKKEIDHLTSVADTLKAEIVFEMNNEDIKNYESDLGTITLVSERVGQRFNQKLAKDYFTVNNIDTEQFMKESKTKAFVKIMSAESAKVVRSFLEDKK